LFTKLFIFCRYKQIGTGQISSYFGSKFFTYLYRRSMWNLRNSFAIFIFLWLHFYHKRKYKNGEWKVLDFIYSLKIEKRYQRILDIKKEMLKYRKYLFWNCYKVDEKSVIVMKNRIKVEKWKNWESRNLSYN